MWQAATIVRFALVDAMLFGYIDIADFELPHMAAKLLLGVRTPQISIYACERGCTGLEHVRKIKIRFQSRESLHLKMRIGTPEAPLRVFRPVYCQYPPVYCLRRCNTQVSIESFNSQCNIHVPE